MRPIAVRSLHPRLRFSRVAVIRALRTLDRNHESLARRASTLRSPDELSVVFLTDSALARLHADFLGDPAPTDVITFRGEPALGSAGEICVSADAAGRSAARRGAAVSEELSLYLVHGWLHLAGHRDKAPRARRAMRAAESRALRLLRRARSLPKFQLT